MSSMMRRSSELLEVARLFRAGRSSTDAAIFDFLSSLGSPRALTVWLLYKHKEHDQLTALDINPDWYSNKYRFRVDFTATSFLSKASFLNTSFDKKQVAFDKFRKFETLCGQTNYRFKHPGLDPLNKGTNVWLLNAIKRKIAQILGDFTADEFVREANWGPGVSTLIKGEEVSGINKFHAERGITHDLYSLVGSWFPEAYPLWHSHLTAQSNGTEHWHEPQVGNVIVTVPKNSKADRVIAIEPGINLWFQKAIGTMIRRRLHRFGIDLNRQSINAELARSASIDLDLATADFSSASDSIATEMVREILPPRWYMLLDSCRSKVGKLQSDDSILRWKKFSSMGNGFTFELESLIFYSAAKVIQEMTGSEGRIYVHGDDVILPLSDFALYSEFSTFLGFKINEEKSCYTGYYRESCGAFWYSGLDCKPLYLKERLHHVESLYRLANGVRNLAHRYRRYDGCDSRFLDCWRHLVERVPEPLRLCVPRSAGDVGIVGNFDEARPARARYGIEGYYYRALATSAVKRSHDGVATLLQRLWVPSELEYNNSYALRGRTRRIISNSLVAQWYNLGEWI